MIEPISELLTHLEGHTPTVTYHGAISVELQHMLLHIIEQHSYRMELPRQARKRLIALSVECLNNLYHHAEDRDQEGVGFEQVFFSLGKTVGHCYIASGNFVTKGAAEFLEKRLTQLRKMTVPQLNEHFLQILANPVRSTKGGGGLGLVEMMRKTECNIEFSLKAHHSDRYYFLLVLNLPQPI
jgi:hypothetical protein